MSQQQYNRDDKKLSRAMYERIESGDDLSNKKRRESIHLDKQDHALSLWYLDNATNDKMKVVDNPERVRVLLAAGVDVNEGRTGVNHRFQVNTPLHRVYNPEVADVLISAGADINAGLNMYDDFTCLTNGGAIWEEDDDFIEATAIRTGPVFTSPNPAVVRMLIESGARLEYDIFCCETDNPSPAKFRMLVAGGAHIKPATFIDMVKTYPLFKFCTHSELDEMIRILLPGLAEYPDLGITLAEVSQLIVSSSSRLSAPHFMHCFSLHAPSACHLRWVAIILLTSSLRT